MIYCLILLAFLAMLSIILPKRFFQSFIGDSIIKSEKLLDLQYTYGIKGVAILLICISHISGTMHTVVFTPFGGIGVSLFLICSGYGLNESYKKKGLNAYWGKKIRRVFIPYALVVTCIAIYNQEFSFQSYLLNVTGLVTSYWYIGYLMKWYIAFWVFCMIAPKYRLFLMLILSVVLFAILPEIEAEQSLSFVVGAIISEYIISIREKKNSSLMSFILVCFLIGIVSLAIKQLPEVRELPQNVYNIVQLLIKLPFALALLLGMNFIKWNKISPFLTFIGIISYEMYLLQMPFYPSLNGTLWMALLFMIALIIASYCFSWINIKIANIIK